MNLYETVKTAVPVPEAAGKYGLKVKRHDMALCPFHDDRHPSLKLNRDFYYCFGCGEKGDVVDLVSKLLGISPYEAARRLCEDFGIDPERPPETMAVKPKHPLIRAFREDECYCQRVLCDYLRLLEDWKVRYAPKSMAGEPDDRFTEACQMQPLIEYLADILTVGDLDHREAAVKKLMANGMITGLEERVNRAFEEEKKQVKKEEKEVPYDEKTKSAS